MDALGIAAFGVFEEVTSQLFSDAYLHKLKDIFGRFGMGRLMKIHHVSRIVIGERDIVIEFER